MDPSEVEKRLRTLGEGRLLFARIEACIRTGIFDNEFHKELLERVACKSTTTDDASVLFRKTKDCLAALADDEVVCRLRREFSEAAPAPFDAVRILTVDTFVAYYTIFQTEDGGSSSARETIDREPDLGGSSSTTEDEILVESDNKLLPTINLCGAGCRAYVASKFEWEKRIAGHENPADASVDWLGFPAAADTKFVALLVDREVNLGWSTCHRPSLLDAVEHTWWWCWHDDPLHHGHTVVISSLECGRLERGAREWVVGSIDIDTSSGIVARRHLGKVTKSTIRESQTDAWSNFLQLTTGG